MKIIEAMKQIKDLQIKAEDLKKKIQHNHAHLSYESPIYGAEQKNRIDEWLQGYSDILKEILRLRVSVQKTNLSKDVTIELDGKQVTKSIAEWIHRRRDLASLEQSLWGSVGDRGLKEGLVKSSSGESMEVKIRRYYDPNERDKKIELYRSEPSIIDRTLEVTNAVTDLS